RPVGRALYAACQFSTLPLLLPLPVFFNLPPTSEIYTLSLHDALPILEADPHADEVTVFLGLDAGEPLEELPLRLRVDTEAVVDEDRKSTRLNSSHGSISYAVFCLKKKKRKKKRHELYQSNSGRQTLR